jgi:predicted enzyme related to lactoylglutathione lyase
MVKNITLIVYPVKDIGKAKTFFTRFSGVEPCVDSSYYVGYKAGNQEVGLVPNSKVGPIAYTDVKDINASLREMTGAGGEIAQDVRNVGNGLLMAQIIDMDGNIVGLR